MVYHLRLIYQKRNINRMKDYHHLLIVIIVDICTIIASQEVYLRIFLRSNNATNVLNYCNRIKVYNVSFKNKKLKFINCKLILNV